MRALVPSAELWLACCLGSTLFLSALRADENKSTDEPPATVPQFSLSDAQGQLHSRDQWQQSKAVVLVFLGAECPVSNGYSPTFRKLAEKYASLGVLVIGVHSDATVTAQVAAQHAREYSLPFATLLDHEQLLAHGCGVRITPEAVVARANGEVMYRGRIDNKYSLDGKRRDEPSEFDLQAAIDATLAGKVPTVRQTKAFGCPLPRLVAR